MGTALLALCFCTLSLVLALFVGISPISEKAKIRFMYVGCGLLVIGRWLKCKSHHQFIPPIYQRPSTNNPQPITHNPLFLSKNKKSIKKIWLYQKKTLPLHPQLRNIAHICWRDSSVG